MAESGSSGVITRLTLPTLLHTEYSYKMKRKTIKVSSKMDDSYKHNQIETLNLQIRD